MPNEFVENLSVFFDGEFSEAVTLAGESVTGIFDDPFSAIDEIEGSAPSFQTATASLPAGLQDGSLLVRSNPTRNYTVRGIRPSGNGVTVLLLQEAP